MAQREIFADQGPVASSSARDRTREQRRREEVRRDGSASRSRPTSASRPTSSTSTPRNGLSRTASSNLSPKKGVSVKPRAPSAGRAVPSGRSPSNAARAEARVPERNITMKQAELNSAKEVELLWKGATSSILGFLDEVVQANIQALQAHHAKVTGGVEVSPKAAKASSKRSEVSAKAPPGPPSPTAKPAPSSRVEPRSPAPYSYINSRIDTGARSRHPAPAAAPPRQHPAPSASSTTSPAPTPTPSTSAPSSQPSRAAPGLASSAFPGSSSGRARIERPPPDTAVRRGGPRVKIEQPGSPAGTSSTMMGSPPSARQHKGGDPPARGPPAVAWEGAGTVPAPSIAIPTGNFLPPQLESPPHTGVVAPPEADEPMPEPSTIAFGSKEADEAIRQARAELEALSDMPTGWGGGDEGWECMLCQHENGSDDATCRACRRARN